jgi:hypothetical protein
MYENKHLPLSDNRVATVDSDVFDAAAIYRWCVNGQGYVHAYVPGSRKTGKWKFIRLHHLVLGTPPSGFVTDHIDGNKLNNTRTNLRFVTQRQNARNSTKKRGASMYKGIHLARSSYYATVRIDNFWLRSIPYATEHQAAAAYNQFATAAFGEFARLNTIDNPPAVDAIADYAIYCTDRKTFAKGMQILGRAA